EPSKETGEHPDGLVDEPLKRLMTAGIQHAERMPAAVLPCTPASPVNGRLEPEPAPVPLHWMPDKAGHRRIAAPHFVVSPALAGRGMRTSDTVDLQNPACLQSLADFLGVRAACLRHPQQHEVATREIDHGSLPPPM